jgi:hypothetical protein
MEPFGLGTIYIRLGTICFLMLPRLIMFAYNVIHLAIEDDNSKTISMDLDKHWIDLKCPFCEYEIETQLISTQLEESIICHNCKLTIQLQDAMASVYIGTRNVQRAFNNLINTIKKIK